MSLGKVKEKIATLKEIMDLSGFALKEPTDTATPEQLAEADYWLGELITDFVEVFDSIHKQEHTGGSFWENMKVLGLQDNYGLMSDLQVCLDMRRLLKKFKRRCIKRLPVLFGGVERSKKKAKNEETEASAEA